MKRFLLTAASLGFFLGFVSCERHSWDETKKLSEPHGHGSHAHGEHGAAGHDDHAHGEKGHESHGHEEKKDAHGH